MQQAGTVACCIAIMSAWGDRREVPMKAPKCGVGRHSIEKTAAQCGRATLCGRVDVLYMRTVGERADIMYARAGALVGKACAL